MFDLLLINVFLDWSFLVRWLATSRMICRTFAREKETFHLHKSQNMRRSLKESTEVFFRSTHIVLHKEFHGAKFGLDFGMQVKKIYRFIWRTKARAWRPNPCLLCFPSSRKLCHPWKLRHPRKTCLKNGLFLLWLTWNWWRLLLVLRVRMKDHRPEKFYRLLVWWRLFLVLRVRIKDHQPEKFYRLLVWSLLRLFQKTPECLPRLIVQNLRFQSKMLPKQVGPNHLRFHHQVGEQVLQVLWNQKNRLQEQTDGTRWYRSLRRTRYYQSLHLEILKIKAFKMMRTWRLSKLEMLKIKAFKMMRTWRLSKQRLLRKQRFLWKKRMMAWRQIPSMKKSVVSLCLPRRKLSSMMMQWITWRILFANFCTEVWKMPKRRIQLTKGMLWRIFCSWLLSLLSWILFVKQADKCICNWKAIGTTIMLIELGDRLMNSLWRNGLPMGEVVGCGSTWSRLVLGISHLMIPQTWDNGRIGWHKNNW